jgi:hypothetical protein
VDVILARGSEIQTVEIPLVRRLDRVQVTVRRIHSGNLVERRRHQVALGVGVAHPERVSELVRGDDLDLLGILDVVPGA